MNKIICTLLASLLNIALGFAATFNLNVTVTPHGGGSLNVSSGVYEENSRVYLSTSYNTGYVFKGWYEEDALISSATSFYYTMPNRDVSLLAKYEYNPTVPANPAMPDTTTYYNLEATVSPVGAGTLNTYKGKYACQASVAMRSYTNSGYRFVGWQNEEGVMLSASTSFNYSMPSHDCRLTALYEYDPTVPANPDSIGTNYTVSVKCKPMGGGTFNNNSFTSPEGGSVHIYAYTNTSYKFIHWEDENGNVIATEQNFYYVMPHGNSTVYGVFDYNPALPGNPSKNYWNKELGELIIDDFTAGSLNSAAYDAIKRGNRGDVEMITVAGNMSYNDFGVANDYTSCTLLDLSRVTGITTVPSYAFDYTNLESVYLPSTVEKIGFRAFYDCKQLASLTVYAVVPPTLDSNVFTGVQEGLVVYVPAASVPQYQDAAGWQDFTILPIQDDVCNLSVSLPQGTNVADYSQMSLELTNTKSGQRMHYVMTDRTLYTFANIIRNTAWDVVLRSQRGDILGKIEGVEVKDEDVTVSFSSLAKPQSIKLSVLTPDGTDVSRNTQITWLDASGNYLSQGTGISGLMAGNTYSYKVALSQELAMQYVTPQQTEYVVTDGNNNIKLNLETIKQVTLSGSVKDLASKTAIASAVITASQTFAGQYSKTVSTKTDAKGRYTLTVSQVPTSLGVSAQDYISQTITCDSLMKGNNAVSIPDVALKGISGAVINLSLTYTKCPEKAGGDNTVQNWYSDYNNVTYRIYNKTKEQEIGKFHVQYPQIVLLEEVNEGDVLEMTATSKTGAFMPVNATATIDAEQNAKAVFSIVELGKIKASFAKNSNATVVGSLYDANGKLLKSYNYSNASLTIGNLTDGSYTLVSMGGSDLFNSIYDLAQLPQTGLVSGSDYTQTSVEVKSGKISVIYIDELPTLDESKLYYTGSNTSFTVNKPSIVAGNYLTLSGRIDFKPEYLRDVNNVNLIVDLPESCQFVENSVMVGNGTSGYTLQGNRLTIPMVRYTDRVRFCIIPTLGGEYAPSAFAQFDLDGETITQPIGSANYAAKDLSINVPTVAAKTKIAVSGTAIGKSKVEIYDGDVLIGQTNSLANGSWSAQCELNKAYNLSKHDISAKVITRDGLELVSETKQCSYDRNAIRPQKVTMYHWNPSMHTMYESVFDFDNPALKPNQWTVYYPKKQFTYTIDFTNNSPECIHDVVLYVHAANGKIAKVTPQYDESKDLWIAEIDMGRSNDGYYPVNVSLNYSYDATHAYIDYAEIEDIYDYAAFDIHDAISNINKYDSILSLLDVNLSQEELDSLYELCHRDINTYSDSLQIQELYERFLNMSESDLEAYTDSVLNSVSNIDELEVIKYYRDQMDLLTSFDYTYSYDGLDFMVSRRTCEGLTSQSLLDSGYLAVATDSGDSIFVKGGNDFVEVVDFRADFWQKIELQDSGLLHSNGMTEGMWETAMDALNKCNDQLVKVSTGVKDAMIEIEAFLGSEIDKLTNQAKNLRLAAKINGWESEVLTVDAVRFQAHAYVLEERAAFYSKLAAGARIASKAIIGRTVQLLGSVATLINDVQNWWNLQKRIDAKIPCKGNEAYAEELSSDITYYGALICTGDVVTLAGAVFAIYSAVAGLLSAPETGGAGAVIGGASGLIAAGVSIGAGVLFDYVSSSYYAEMKNAVDNLKCKDDDDDEDDENDDDEDDEDDDEDDEDDEDDDGGPYKPNSPNDDVRIDPSGFVYEGVFSNRLEGVTATAFYKETVEDMYGDLHENVVKWDAEQYAQENPLFTDANGYYRWDVPQGMWQVKFEKEGYETTYSEWLPVPPPQLEVNVAMTQNVQPNVKSARAYPNAVEVEFDKYMMPELLTTDNIIVMAGDNQVAGSIELLNEEVKYEGLTETYASKLRFNANAPFTGTEVTLMVNNRVKSYAGIRMQDNYSQSFTIEQEIQKIVSDSVAVIGYAQSGLIHVAVLPAGASAGKKLVISNSSPMILATDTTSMELDENGMAEIPVRGELPGTGAIVVTVEGYDISATSMVNVEQIKVTEIEAPKASIASGTTVAKGTTITLTCSTEGATIYYTLDGSCPCDETVRLTYTEPIVINETVTINAISVAADMTESEVVEFTYTVDTSDGIDDVAINENVRIYPLPVRERLNITVGGKVISSVTLTSAAGTIAAKASEPATQVTLHVGSLTPGIYVITIVTEDKTYSRKIVKVN